MTIYTVHEPPRRQSDQVHADGFRFVRDGFYLWAFVFPPLWMIWHRLWLVLLLSAAGIAVLDFGLAASRIPATSIVIIDLLIAWLVALEASSLRRWTLARRGWRFAGIVSAQNPQEAERRFFDKWAGPVESPAPPERPQPALHPRRPPEGPGVVGLFPEPGPR